MLRAGIVGFGGLGHVHANSLWILDNVEVKAVCDINPAQLEKKEIAFNIEQAPNQFDISTCNTYTDYKEMLKNEELDVMVIALPTCIHAEYSILAMSHGCHVICEKPMAMNAEECDRVIEAKNKYKREFMVAQCIRFWPEYEYLYEVIKTQPYGKFHSMFMQRAGGYPSADRKNWFMDHTQSGGALLDLHVHDVDFMQYALGHPVKIDAVGVRGWTGGVDDHTGIFRFTDGSIVTIRCSWMQIAGFGMSFLAVFENGSLTFNVDGQGKLYHHSRESAEPELIEVSKESAYVREMRYFLECAAGEHENTKCTAESSRNSIFLAKEQERIILSK